VGDRAESIAREWITSSLVAIPVRRRIDIDILEFTQGFALPGLRAVGLRQSAEPMPCRSQSDFGG
jgi:hypothetical protein